MDHELIFLLTFSLHDIFNPIERMKAMLNHEPQILIYEKATTNDLATIAANWEIDPSLFEKITSATEVSQFSSLPQRIMTNAKLLITFDFNYSTSAIEKELLPIIAIFDQKHLILCSSGDLSELKNKIRDLTEPLTIIIHSLLFQNQHLDQKLSQIKRKIDQLDQAARQTTKTKELTALTDVTRELVYLEHTLEDQAETITAFCAYLTNQQLVASNLIQKLQVQQRRLTKTIHVYRDLLDSINDLFAAMMDSHLNHLMKFLDSTALIISVPALISGLWGMNVGGLPGKNNKFGFWLVIALAFFLALVSSILLKRKKYND